MQLRQRQKAQEAQEAFSPVLVAAGSIAVQEGAAAQSLRTTPSGNEPRGSITLAEPQAGMSPQAAAFEAIWSAPTSSARYSCCWLDANQHCHPRHLAICSILEVLLPQALSCCSGEAGECHIIISILIVPQHLLLSRALKLQQHVGLLASSMMDSKPQCSSGPAQLPAWHWPVQELHTVAYALQHRGHD